MMMLAILVFSGALAGSCYAMFATIAPNLDKIGDALAGRERIFVAVDVPTSAMRRTVVRRWSAAPVQGSPARPRAVA